MTIISSTTKFCRQLSSSFLYKVKVKYESPNQRRFTKFAPILIQKLQNHRLNREGGGEINQVKNIEVQTQEHPIDKLKQNVDNRHLIKHQITVILLKLDSIFKTYILHVNNRCDSLATKPITKQILIKSTISK